MTPQERFIQLRADGYSLRACSSILDIALSTAEEWEKDLKAQIAERHESNLKALYARYYATRENLYERVAQTVQDIDAELAKRDLTDVRTEKLIELQLKGLDRLNKLYIPLQEKEPNTDVLRPLLVQLVRELYINPIQALEAPRKSQNALLDGAICEETVQLKNDTE